MTAPKDSSFRSALDRTNPNTLSNGLQAIALGSLLQGQMPQCRRQVNAVGAGNAGYNLATLLAIPLPASGKAAAISRATVRAGGVTGELTPVAYGTTPATGQIAVGPNGDIVTLAADAITDLDVTYLAERADVIETVFPVVANVISLPAAIVAQGVVLLAEVEALAGTSVGKKIVLIPGAGAPSAGQARLNLAKSTITFATADAVTRARVTLSVVAAEQLATLLESDSTII